MNHRVVITGCGAVTPVGNDVDTFWNNIKNGVNGIETITSFDVSEFKAKVAGEVKDFDPLLYIEKKEVKRMDRFCQMGLAAAIQAVKESGLALDKIDHDRVGVVATSGIGGLQTYSIEHQKLLEKGPQRVAPLFSPMMIINILPGHIAIKFQAKGSCTSVVTACSSGTHAVGEAFRQIKHGYLDLAIAGAGEAAITPLGLAGFINLSALSTMEDPEKASRPFDKERDGFVMGEGAGMVVMESLEHAQQRGANILAEIVGYGSTCDAYHITAPEQSGKGAARAMTLAMEEGGVRPEEVGYLNAHGTSTYYNDLCETNAVKLSFGDAAKQLSISSTKSMTGHLLGAAGGIETVICVKALQEGIIPPTIHYHTPDPELDLDYTPNESRKREINYAMSNSLGFGGHNATLLLKKWNG